jgi:hypothetical protein
MQSMSQYLAKLEGHPNFDPLFIRTTKINKVMKAILKLSSIPREDEFNFKSRSQALLDRMNHALTAEKVNSTPQCFG